MKVLFVALFYGALMLSCPVSDAGVLEDQESGIICERIDNTFDAAVMHLNRRVQRYDEEQSKIGLGTIIDGMTGSHRVQKYLALTSLQYIKTPDRDYACVIFEKKPEK